METNQLTQDSLHDVQATGELNNDFKDCLISLMEHGMTAHPRGTTTKEVLNYNITLFNPRNRVITFPDRKVNHKYLLGEFIWYLLGSNDPAGILPYSKFWDNIRNADGTINSNYGYRFFGHHDDCLVDRGYDDRLSQWSTVVDILSKDADSRQAIMNVHLPQDRTAVNKDVPCTLSLQFFIREGRLHLIVNMRSNDIILGFTNDVFQFTMLQECMMMELRQAYLDLELGLYFHNAGSMHIYDRHFEMADKIIAADTPQESYMQPMDAFNEDIIRCLVACEGAWQAAGAPADFDWSALGAFTALTPYWQTLLKTFFTGEQLQ